VDAFFLKGGEKEIAPLAGKKLAKTDFAAGEERKVAPFLASKAVEKNR